MRGRRMVALPQRTLAGTEVRSLAAPSSTPFPLSPVVDTFSAPVQA